MTIYAVEFAASAEKELSKLTPVVRTRIAAGLQKLSTNPRAGSVRPMVGSKAWRLRVGDYRVIYDIYDARLVVLVLRIRHRRDAYKH